LKLGAMIRNNCFSLILLMFILAFFGSFIIIYLWNFPCGLEQAIKPKVEVINANITQQLRNFTDWDNSTKLEFRESTFREMIGWGLQRQITWGIVIFTVMTLFLMVLFEIRAMILNKDNENGQKRRYIRLLTLAGLILLVSGSLSMIMLLWQYAEVSYLEGYLLVPPPPSPISPIFFYTFGIVVFLFVLSLLLFFSYEIGHKLSKKRKR
jgi:hypothetical protein